MLKSIFQILIIIVYLIDSSNSNFESQATINRIRKFSLPYQMVEQEYGNQIHLLLMHIKQSYAKTNKKEAKGDKTDQDIQSFTTDSYEQNRRNLYPHLVGSEKIKSNPSFSLDKISTRTLEIAKTTLVPDSKKKDTVKLPPIRGTVNNPQSLENQSSANKDKLKDVQDHKLHYQSNLYRCLKKHETNYLMNLYRQHFYQCVEVLRFGKSIKIPTPRKEIKLNKKNPHFKTIFLDMDETLIHCDQTSSNYTVKLNFPLESGGVLAAGVRIRPYCKEFLEQLSQFAEIIIFTASSASYADVVLDYLDPEKKYISHRLYRQHCTLEKGYFLKDLRVVNRKLQDSVLVDNSPYCHILQPENAIPIVPFYHFTKDRELETLLEYLKTIIAAADTRTVIAQTYFWDRYIREPGDPRRLFFKYYQKESARP